MNFVGHIEVARTFRATTVRSSEFLLGSALPDLAAMGRFRLAARSADPDIAAGVDLHHRTDDVFHRHRLFRSTSVALTSALSEAGLPRGAALACGHVGVELLLDGHLLERRRGLRAAVEAAIEAAGSHAEALSELVEPDRRAEWKHHLQRLSDWPIPDDYHETEAVAERLQRILSRRPRLRFPASAIGRVADGLDGQHHLVTGGAEGLLDDLNRELTEIG